MIDRVVGRIARRAVVVHDSGSVGGRRGDYNCASRGTIAAEVVVTRHRRRQYRRPAVLGDGVVVVERRRGVVDNGIRQVELLVPVSSSIDVEETVALFESIDARLAGTSA